MPAQLAHIAHLRRQVLDDFSLYVERHRGDARLTIVGVPTVSRRWQEWCEEVGVGGQIIGAYGWERQLSLIWVCQVVGRLEYPLNDKERQVLTDLSREVNELGIAEKPHAGSNTGF